MSFTVDRPTDEAVALREVSGAMMDPHQTGYRVMIFGDFPTQSMTNDQPEKALMMAAHQMVGSFVPVPLEVSGSFLTDFLSCDWMALSVFGDEAEDDLMVLPPPYFRRMNLRIHNVFYGVPDSDAFEE